MEGVNCVIAGVGWGPRALNVGAEGGSKHRGDDRVIMVAALRGCCRVVGLYVALQFNKFKFRQCWQRPLWARQPAI